MTKTLLFDLDDTLVDINITRELIVQKIFKDLLNVDMAPGDIKQELRKYKKEDYLETIKSVLDANNVNIKLNELINKFTEYYSIIAQNTEKLIITKETLNYLKIKYNLCIITGRPRQFYDLIWKDRFKEYFKYVVCQGDFKDTPRKPEPDIILKTIKKYNLDTDYYIGNTIKDIIATKKANLKSICVMHTEKDKSLLINSGCDIVINSINDLKNIL